MTETLHRLRDNWDLIAATLVTTIGVALLAVLLRSGVGVTPDSVYYFSAANSILDGRGAAVMFDRDPGGLISHWPPGYAYALAAFSVSGDVARGAAALNLAALTLSSMAGAVVIRAVAGRSWLVVVSPLLLILSPNVLAIHTWMLSEAFFMTASLGATAALIWGLRKRLYTLVVMAGLLSGVAVTLRYVGLGVVVAGAVAVILSGQRHRRRLLAAYSAPALALSMFALTYGGSARSQVRWHPPTSADWNALFRTAQGWVLPHGRYPMAGLVVLALTSVALAAIFHKGPRDQWIVALMPASVLATILGSRFVLDAAIPFDARMLLPTQALALLAAVTALTLSNNLRALGAGALTCMLLLTFVAAPPTGGVGYRDWGGRPVVLWAAEEQGQVWSNSPALVHFHSGLPVLPLPHLVDAAGVRNDAFDSQLGVVCGAGSVVYELPPSLPSHRRIPSVALLTQRGFVVTVVTPQGVRLSPPPCK
jgi:hypothetical protein